MKNLAIFYGGKSTEHDISIITALQVMNNIDASKYNIVPVYIHTDNSWFVLDDYKNINIYAKNILKGKQLVTGFFDKKLIIKKKNKYKEFLNIDIAINCCHGLNGEDGTLSGLLTLNNIPFVGSNVLASSIGMDKIVMKDVFVANKIPCTKYIWFDALKYKQNEQDYLLLAEIKLDYPIVVKPANLGSSIGINISKNREELQKNIKIALNFDKKVILEQCVPNLREINCSCIGNSKNTEISVLEEPKNWKTFLDFDEKYMSNSSTNKKTIDVKLDAKLEAKIKDLTKRVFTLLNCQGVARVDFLLDDKSGKIYVNEINTIPGSFAFYLWKHKYTFTELLNKLIDYALEEYLYTQENNYTHKTTVLNNYLASTKLTKISGGCKLKNK